MKRQIAATVAALMSISLLAPAVYAEETVPITAPETVQSETAEPEQPEDAEFILPSAKAAADSANETDESPSTEETPSPTEANTDIEENIPADMPTPAPETTETSLSENADSPTFDAASGKSSDVTVGSWTYRIANGKASIVSYNGSSTIVTVPSAITVDGMTYKIGELCSEAFKDNISLKAVKIPESITLLGKCAFKNCTNLSNVTINGDLGDMYSDSASRSYSINYSAFYNAGTNTDGMKVVFGSSVTRIPAYLFATGEEKNNKNYAKVTEVVLPASLNEIGKNAFYNCYDLQTVNTSSATNLKVIEADAFNGCFSLQTVDASKTTKLTTVEDGSFANCTSLREITLPKSVTKLGKCAFKNCTNLSNVTINGNLGDMYSDSVSRSYSISYSAFYNAGTNTDGMKVVFGSSVTRIPAYLFATGEEKSNSVYARVIRVDIPGSVKQIGRDAFSNCYDLNTIQFEGNAPKIESNSFSNVVSKVLYPKNKSGWNSSTCINYGGTLTWVPYYDGTESPFPDVSKGDWFYEDALYVYKNNLMNGIPNAEGETCFEPDAPTSRAMVVTILYRMSGCPEVSEANKFSDVENDSWYTDAVIWASENGIVTGYAGTDQFGTNDPITREQMAVMMYRYAQYNGKDTSASASLDSFTDCEQVHSWAKDAFAWANAEGLIGGKPTDDGKFFLDPAGNAVRSQAAAILHRYCENI